LSLPLVFFLLAKSVFFGGIKRLKYIIICEVLHFLCFV
jgi:hypothetical protein